MTYSGRDGRRIGMIGTMPRRFVGRAAELAALEAALAAAGRRSRRRVVLVGGEAGVGKTRLVAELAGRARGRRGRSSPSGACVELTAGTAPYLAATEALRDLARAVGAARVGAHVRGRAARAGARCCRARAGAPGAVRADDASRARLFGQVHDLLAEAAVDGAAAAGARGRPLGRPLDARPRRLTSPAPLRTSGSCSSPPTGATRWRAGRRCAPGWPSSGAWTACGGSSSTPFSAAEIAELLAAILGSAPDPAPPPRSRSRSGGNAFLAEELLAAAGDDDRQASRRRCATCCDARSPRCAPPRRPSCAPPPPPARASTTSCWPRSCELPPPELGGGASRGRRAPPAHRPTRATAGSASGTSSSARRRTRRCCPASGGGCTPRARACSTERPGARRREPRLGGRGVAAPLGGRRRRRRSALAASVRAAEAAERVHAPSEALGALPAGARAVGARCRDAEGVAGASRLDAARARGPGGVHGGAESRVGAARRGARARRSRAPSRCAPACCTRSRAWYSWAAGTAGPAHVRASRQRARA